MSGDETNGDRRTFMRIATAAGLVGAAAARARIPFRPVPAWPPP